jgi:hypothetical protein
VVEATYRAHLHDIKTQYDAALTNAVTAPRHQPRRLWHAYANARRQQQAAYKEAMRRWAELWALYQRTIKAHQTVQPEGGGSHDNAD